MNDEIFDWHYQSGRKELHDGIDRLAKRVGRALAVTFQTGRRIQFDAPWTHKKRSGVA